MKPLKRSVVTAAMSAGALSLVISAAIPGARPDPGIASRSAQPAFAATLRCWQHGELILSESKLVPAAEPFSYSLKLQSAEHGHLYLTDTRNATCILQLGGPPRPGERR